LLLGRGGLAARDARAEVAIVVVVVAVVVVLQLSSSQFVLVISSLRDLTQLLLLLPLSQ
jgi:hypothetical protein